MHPPRPPWYATGYPDRRFVLAEDVDEGTHIAQRGGAAVFEVDFGGNGSVTAMRSVAHGAQPRCLFAHFYREGVPKALLEVAAARQ